MRVYSRFKDTSRKFRKDFRSGTDREVRNTRSGWFDNNTHRMEEKDHWEMRTKRTVDLTKGKGIDGSYLKINRKFRSGLREKRTRDGHHPS